MAHEDIKTVDDWLRLATQKQAVAEAFVDDKKNCLQAWEATGFAVEYCLKAVIMKEKRFNEWPADRKELWTHNLRELVKLAGIDQNALPPEITANLATVFTWRREHAYAGGKMPRGLANSLVKAAFGENGVVPWLRAMT